MNKLKEFDSRPYSRRVVFVALNCLFWALTLTVGFAHGAIQSESSSSRRRTTITRATSKIVLDGQLNDVDWTTAPLIGEIIQREPRQGSEASERTEVKLLYDDANFYVGVMSFDSEPDRVIGTQMARDGDLGADDTIEILLDTFNDQRNGFYFATNPAGVLVDGLIIENGQLNREWDAIWNVQVQKSDQGWSAEFAIPLKSLTFRSGEQTWGFNISRYIRRKLEEDRWASPRLDIRLFQISEAGEITGFEGMERGTGLDVRPYLSGRYLHAAAADANTLKGKYGLDAFYKVTPNLKLTVTANTDFAETEVDNRQINLTRFALFFPEKRSFFLENAGIFSFSNTGGGNNGGDLIPFFSRRIGLLSGSEIPVLGGVKLAGTAGRYDIGVLDVRTRDNSLSEAKNFAVARIKRKFLRQSYVGGILTNGNPDAALEARTYGGDLRLGTSRFLNTARNAFFDAYAIKSANEATPSDNQSFGVSLDFPSDLLAFSTNWKQIDRNFKPALGFVPRSNVRALNVSTVFGPRPKNFLGVRRMSHELRFARFTRLDTGTVESWRLMTAPIHYFFNSGDVVEFNWSPQFERLFTPFEIAPRVTLPAGDYRFTRWRAEFLTASKRRWKVDGTWWFGTYWSGRANEINTSFQYKAAPHFQASLSLNQTFARLDEGSFVTRVVALRSNYSLSPLVTFFNLVQFDNRSKNVGWQSRVRWIVRPGNEVFLVFTQGWIQDESGGFNLHPTDRNVASKVQYTFRF